MGLCLESSIISIKKRKDYSDRELIMELLYSNWKVQHSSERTRSNTSTLVWFVVIGIITSVLSALIGFGAVTAL